MKRFLPIIFFLGVAFVLQSLSLLPLASAQSPAVSPNPSVSVAPTVTPGGPTLTPTPTVPSSLQQNQTSPADLPDDWIIDPEVTSIGKNAARAGIFLDWALQNYDWSYVEPGKQNPLIPFWVTIRNIVYALLVLVIIAGSLVLIVTRGRSVTLQRFLPRFLIIGVLVTFSFAFVQFLYQVVDLFQGFFIRPDGVAISQRNLLFVGWNYQPFVGLRALGDENYESAFISLLLVKLTSFTYYAMVGILLVRKIILWFFIMVSPFFPLLLLFYPLRNTAKIWLGEFFRWLLYAPLFAIFLAGLVSLWRAGIPLFFNFSEAGSGIIFPTAISILLGGPLQNVGIANSVNLADTFGLYLVALLMLWMVIIFPFILLQIFLDYLNNFNVNQNPVMKQMLSFMNRFPPQPPGGQPSPSPATTGLARSLPFFKQFTRPKAPATTGLAREVPRVQQEQKQQQTQTQTVTVTPAQIEKKESVERATNISVPTMRDIARYDTARILKDRERIQDVERLRQSLVSIGNPASIKNQTDREKFTKIYEKLISESKSGNQYATSVLNAATAASTQSTVVRQDTTTINNVVNQLANPATVTNTKEREKIVDMRERLVRERDSRNVLATKVLQLTERITKEATQPINALLDVMSNPSIVTTKLSSAVSSLKETLQKESERGNEIAQSFLRVFERFLAVEKIKESLTTIAAPDTAKNTATKERFVSLSKELTSEKAKQDTFATTLLSEIEHLKEASTHEEKETIIERIRDIVVKAQVSQNPLAIRLATKLPELLSHQKSEETKQFTKTLEEEKAKGNQLAVRLLELSKETSKEKRDKELSALQQEIISAKDKKEPLGSLLYEMMKPEQVAGKPASLPAANRIQEVSLEDYEAVKKMWEENYQNLETTGNVTDREQKKAWIQDDIASISNTIDLLSSENQEQVEQGMEAVADILPFLMVGGFSQSEIVAYLKAKREAGKAVLSEIAKETGSEDTQVEIEQKKGEAPRVQTMTTHVSVDANEKGETTPVSSQLVQAGGKQVVTPASTSSHNISQASTNILRLANLTIPTIKTVASLDESQVSRNPKRVEETNKVKDMLKYIAHPEQSHDVESRQKFGSIREQLTKEAAKGNELAQSIITASNVVAQLSYTATFREVLGLKTLLQSLKDPSQLDAQSKAMYENLLTTIKHDDASGDMLAKEMQAALSQDELSYEQLFALRSKLLQGKTAGNTLSEALLASIDAVDEKTISSQLHRLQAMYQLLSQLQGKKKTQLSQLASSIAEKARGKDALATALTQASTLTAETVLTLSDQLQERVRQNDQFALQIVRELDKATDGNIAAREKGSLRDLLASIIKPLTAPQQDLDEVKQLRQDLAQAKQEGNQLATLILTKAEESEKESISSIAKTLKGIADPTSLADVSAQNTMKNVRQRLATAQEEGNLLAQEVLTIANLIQSKQLTPLDQSTVAVLLYQKLVSSEGDPVADELLKTNEEMRKADRLKNHLEEMLHVLHDPTKVPDETKREQLTTLKAQLEKNKLAGNELATSLLELSDTIAKSKQFDRGLLEAFFSTLTKEAKQGNELATELLKDLRVGQETDRYFAISNVLQSLMDPGDLPSEERKQAIEAIRSQLQSEASAGNTLAMSVLSAAEKAKTSGRDLAESKNIDELLKHEHGELVDTLQEQISESEEDYENELLLKALLHNLQNPKSLPDVSEQKKYERLRDAIRYEAKHDNQAARAIEQALRDLATVQALDQEWNIVHVTYQKLVIEAKRGNARASEILAFLQMMKMQKAAARFAFVLRALTAGSQLLTEEDSVAIQNLKGMLTDARGQGDKLASMVLDISAMLVNGAVQDFDITHMIVLLTEYLAKEKNDGNQLAAGILAMSDTGKSEKSLDEMEQILLDGHAKHDPVADALFDLVDREAGIGAVHVPTNNRIQEVSVDDYESVRQMWTDSYRSLDIPRTLSDAMPTREAWLTDEIKRISATIDDLQSQDKTRVTKGLETVSSILPFLLIGGFSLSEIISYLKAKEQAARTVLSELAGTREPVPAAQNQRDEKELSIAENG